MQNSRRALRGAAGVHSLRSNAADDSQTRFNTLMYNDHFGLREAPFSIAPDPRYLFMSKRHREALAHLMYGIDSPGGFVLLTGEIGTGKTTVCRGLLERMPQDCDVAFIFNPKLTVEELLSTICDELRITYPHTATTVKQFIDRLNAYLLDAHARGRKTLLIIDEAQNLSTDVLEQVRLLTNLETNRRKLLQIILLGQPQLRDMVKRPELQQLAQRIIARYHLGSLSKPEVAAYVAHRLAVAGAHRQVFSASALDRLFRLSGGIPRLINVLCDRALLGAFIENRDYVERATLVRAAREVFGESTTRWHAKALRMLFGGMAALGSAVALAVAFFYYEFHPAVIEARSPVQPSSAAQPITQASHPESQLTVGHTPRAVEETGVSRSPVEPAQLDTLQWTSSEPRRRSAALAYQALFTRWGVAAPLEGNGDACRRAQTLGLRCLSDRGGLDELRRLNRPAVLQLHNDQGQEFFATLTALDGETATLVVGNDTKKISINTLALHWSGSYTLLWRTTPNYGDVIRPGSPRPAVEWLSRQLALAQKRPAEAEKRQVFDEALVRQGREFQLNSGLLPDGVVGPRTLIHLDTAVDGGSPRLVGQQKAE